MLTWWSKATRDCGGGRELPSAGDQRRQEGDDQPKESNAERAQGEGEHSASQRCTGDLFEVHEQAEEEPPADTEATSAHKTSVDKEGHPTAEGAGRRRQRRACIKCATIILGRLQMQNIIVEKLIITTEGKSKIIIIKLNRRCPEHTPEEDSDGPTREPRRASPEQPPWRPKLLQRRRRQSRGEQR